MILCRRMVASAHADSDDVCALLARLSAPRCFGRGAVVPGHPPLLMAYAPDGTASCVPGGCTDRCLLAPPVHRPAVSGLCCVGPFWGSASGLFGPNVLSVLSSAVVSHAFSRLAYSTHRAFLQYAEQHLSFRIHGLSKRASRTYGSCTCLVFVGRFAAYFGSVFHFGVAGRGLFTVVAKLVVPSALRWWQRPLAAPRASDVVSPPISPLLLLYLLPVLHFYAVAFSLCCPGVSLASVTRGYCFLPLISVLAGTLLSAAEVLAAGGQAGLQLFQPGFGFFWPHMDCSSGLVGSRFRCVWPRKLCFIIYPFFDVGVSCAGAGLGRGFLPDSCLLFL